MTASETEDSYPLSLQLAFLQMMDSGSGSGPFGPRYTIVVGWRVLGALDEPSLRAALDDVVARHEALRTEIVVDAEGARQVVRPPCSPSLRVDELLDGDDRDQIVEEYLNDVELNVSIGAAAPRMAAALGRFDADDAVLVLVVHHTMADGWGLRVLQRDLAACYDARRAGQEPALAPAPQYRDFVAWQLAELDSPAVARSRAFWRTHLDGARVLPMPTDRPRSPEAYVTGWHRFMLEEEFRAATLGAARTHRCSPFMVLTAALLRVLHARTGETDITLPTMTPGRSPSWTADVVGTFYNFTPLRFDISGCTTFAEIVSRVRRGCLAVYQHELPFPLVVSEAPELMSLVMDPGAAALAFQVIQHGEEAEESAGASDLTYTVVRRRTVSTPVGSQIPDGILAELDLHPDGGMFGKVAFVQSMFDESTIVALMADLRQALVEDVLAPSPSSGERAA